jgi:hypothetical protein
MPRVGFETTIPMFEQAKTVHALDLAATVIGNRIFLKRSNSLSTHGLPLAVSICKLLGTFVFQAMELRHLRVVAPRRRIAVTQPHGHQSPAPRIRPAVPFRAQTSSHSRRNVKVPTGKVFMFRTEITGQVCCIPNWIHRGCCRSRAGPSSFFLGRGTALTLLSKTLMRNMKFL